VIISLTITTGSAVAAKRPYRPTCRSGSTLFHHGQVRAFRVSFYDAADRGQHQEALVCLHRSGKPIVIFDPGPFNSVQAGRFHVVGSRLGFVIHDQGFANGSETDVGWVDLRTGAVALGLLNAGENADGGDPLLPETGIRFAFAADGTTAVIAGTACQVVAILPLAAKPSSGARRLGPPRVLLTAPTGGLDAASIAITPTTVTWRTTTGTPGSVPLSGGPTAPMSQTGGC
jgi:hypothetical protein